METRTIDTAANGRHQVARSASEAVMAVRDGPGGKRTAVKSDGLAGSHHAGLPTGSSETCRLVYLGRMISAVSHELNNRLSSVVGFAELLSLKDAPPDIERLVSKLRTYTENLRHFAEGLSGFSKKRVSAPVASDPTPFIRQTFDLAACEAKTRSVKMILQVQGDLPEVTLRGPEFRLGLFIILDSVIRALAEAPNAPVPRGTMLVNCSESQGGCAVEVVVTSAGEAFWGGPEQPDLDGLPQARSILESQGITCRWEHQQEVGWKYGLEIARS